MIQIRSRPGAIYASGHAGYAAQGQDIVCSAVSILLCTLSRRLEQLDCGTLHTCLEPGNSVIRCDRPNRDTAAAFAFVRTGLEMISHCYPQCVELLDS